MKQYLKKLSGLEKALKVKFKNKEILLQACVHRSYLNEHENFKLGHNERLEFLGDAVLELVVTEYLYKNYPNPEGELTNWRASLVNSKMLANVANELDLDKYLLMSRGEQKDKGKARAYILANAVEALVGAIYLDQGIKKITKFINDRILIKLDFIIENRLYKDPKSRLQELSQEKISFTPVYKVLSEKGPDHAKIFEIGVYLGKELVSKAKGSSKQEAQTKAAEKAIKEKGWDH